MIGRRRVGVALIALGVVALGLALSASPVNADAPQQAGWWFELQTKALPAPLPAVPVVPDGGLLVQQGPQGPTAYGALRYRVTDAETGLLTLAAAQGSTSSLGAPLQGCATSSSWQQPAAAPGDWEDAPKYGSPCTPGRISTDGKFVAFAFDSSFFKNGVLDVAIVPIDGASPFTIAFDKPAADSLAIQATRQPVAPVTTVAPVASAPSDVASPVVVGGAKTPTITPVSPAAVATTNESRPSIANTALNIVGLGDPDRGERAAALGGASAIVLGWWMLSTQAVRTPRLLGGMRGEDPEPKERPARMGGVGRFNRKREKDALSLR